MKIMILLFVIVTTIFGCATQTPIVTEIPTVTQEKIRATSVLNDDIFRVRLFFGLSVPNGGAVSLSDWEEFERKQISQYFEGYNIVDSTGFYKGEPERSKIATFIVLKTDIPKIKELASAYAKQFQQESVMMVSVPVSEWSFIEAEK